MPFHIGGQLIGFNSADTPFSTIATATTDSLTTQQLIDLDLAYAPPFSTACDPVQIAARKFI
jgi:hypothetical protein